MNTLRQTCVAVALGLVLAGSALAGQISSTGVIATPPQPPSEASTSTGITTTIIVTFVNLILVR